MNKLIFIIIITFYSTIFSYQNSFSQPNWFWQNPLPLGNDLYTIQFIDENTGYAAGWGFTILKTSNSGVDWLLANHSVDSIPIGESTGGKITSMFFLNTETGFIGLESDYITGADLFKTTNGGITWIYHSPQIPRGVNSIYFVDSITGYVLGEQNSLTKTTNGGINWFLIPTQFTSNSYFEKILFTSRDTGYIAGEYNYKSAVFKTTNTGINWYLQYSDGNDLLEDICFVNAETGFVVGRNSILKTVNSGNNWSNIGQSFGYIQKIFFTSASTGYITDVTYLFYPTGWNYANKILKTTNAGNSWDSIFIGTYPYGFSFVNANTGYMPSSGGQILKTTNAGENWNNQTHNVTTDGLSSVYFKSENMGFIVGANSTILKTNDSGSSWIKDTIPYRDNFTSIKFFDNNNGILRGSSILKTSNGGIIWDSVAHFDNINVFESVNPDTMYFTKAGSLYKSFDGGNTWTSQSIHPNLQGFYFYKNNDTGFVVVSIPQGCFHCPPDHVEFYKTTNNGINWNLLSTTGGLLTYIHFTSNQVGFASGYSGFFKTTNGGVSWACTFSIYALTATPYFYNSNLIYIFMGNTVYKSTNAGNNWNYIFASSNQIQSSFFTQINTGYMVGDYGKILKTTNGGGIFVDVSEDIKNVLIDYRLYQNYPNPFNPITKISFDLPFAGKIKLLVYDLLGREVKTIVNEQLSMGRYEYQFDGSNLTSGVYFYRLVMNGANPLTAPDFVQTKRMVLIK